MVIDFSSKREFLTEAYTDAFGQVSQYLLGKMFGFSEKELLDYAWLTMKEEESESPAPEFVIRGKYRDIRAYAQALGLEKDYILALEKYGENHMITTKAKSELDQATNHFERLTGIKWPFK